MSLKKNSLKPIDSDPFFGFKIMSPSRGRMAMINSIEHVRYKCKKVNARKKGNAAFHIYVGRNLISKTKIKDRVKLLFKEQKEHIIFIITKFSENEKSYKLSITQSGGKALNKYFSINATVPEGVYIPESAYAITARHEITEYGIKFWVDKIK